MLVFQWNEAVRAFLIERFDCWQTYFLAIDVRITYSPRDYGNPLIASSAMNQLSIESYKIFQLYPIQSSSHIKHPILTVCSCEILCLKDDRQAKLWFETALKITGAYRFISERNKYNSE